MQCVDPWTKARIVPAIVAALALALPASAARAQGAEQSPWRDVSRVVAFGDVHGAYDALVELLQATSVIGQDLRWTGGATHVVSLGDLIDRGPDTRRVFDLIMRLQGEAATAGGRLHVVLGNHELMNLLGDWRYVSTADYATFAAEEPAAARAAAYAVFVATAAGGDSAATREQFDRAYPLGYFARQAAFAPTGRYGAWLLSLPTIVVVDDTAYVHGGLPSVVAEGGLNLNSRLRASLERYLDLREQLAAQGLLPAADRQHDVEMAHAALATAGPETASLLKEFVALGDAVELGPDGPLWYRGSVYCKPLLETPTLEAALAQLGVRRAVVGHTPTADRRVHTLHGGKLVTADTGMLVEYFRGRPAALVLEEGELEVQYLTPPQQATVETDGSVVAYGRTEAQLRAALERGTVTAVEHGQGAAPWRVELQHEGAVIEATFYPRDGNLELAAAALDDLLGTALVAPTVPRIIEGQDGALQLRYAGAVTNTDRVARGLGFSGWCPIEPQLKLMRTFDVLTFNRYRTSDNVVFANDLTDLTLTDHDRALGTERALPTGLDVSRLAMPAALAATLRALDERELTAALGMWLDSRRIRALLARRDQLLVERPPP